MKYSLTDKLPDCLPMTPPDDPPEPVLDGALPCPECGYPPEWQKRAYLGYRVFCDQGHVDGGWRDTIDKAVEYYNSEVETMKGENLKAEGVAVVAEHNEAWMDAVLAVIRRKAALPSFEFTVENIRRSCVTAGINAPKHPNAWGAAFSVAAKQGLIVRTGYTKNALPSAHARVVAVWKGKS